MKLECITAQKKELFDVEWVELNTNVGNLVIQDQHAPTILTLKSESTVLYKPINQEPRSLKIDTGIAHIQDQGVTLIVLNIVDHEQ